VRFHYKRLGIAPRPLAFFFVAGARPRPRGRGVVSLVPRQYREQQSHDVGDLDHGVKVLVHCENPVAPNAKSRCRFFCISAPSLVLCGGLGDFARHLLTDGPDIFLQEVPLLKVAAAIVEILSPALRHGDLSVRACNLS
jgi:hypothetical protein